MRGKLIDRPMLPWTIHAKDESARRCSSFFGASSVVMAGRGPNDDSKKSVSTAAKVADSRREKRDLTMIIKRELSRNGDRQLTEVQFVGVSGQVCSTTYEIGGPETLYFTNRAEAEAGLIAGSVGTADLVATGQAT